MLLEDFQIGPAKRGIRVFLKGASQYVTIVQQAFNQGQWYGPYDSFDKKFNYVLYAHRVEEDKLHDFLGFCKETLFIVSTLEECWAIDYHKTGRLKPRTDIGDLVYRAKTYKGRFGRPKLGVREVAEQLGDRMAGRFKRHPRINRADRILGIPANPPKEPHNLPEVLAERIGRACGIPVDSQLVLKTRRTSEMKNGVLDEARLDQIRGAYEITQNVEEESIVVVDDLLRSGTTLGVVAQALREAGASEVLGIVATKTLRG